MEAIHYLLLGILAAFALLYAGRWQSGGEDRGGAFC